MNAYDFDKTIYDGDSTADFYFYCLTHQPRICMWLPYQGWSFLLYVLGIYSKTQFKERFYSFFKSVGNIEETVEKFWDKNISRIKKWYLETSREDDIIISASPEFLLRPACCRLKIKNLIASRVDFNDGKYTGLNCWGEEKVRRLRDEMGDVTYEHFFSDSYSDTPLAELATAQSYIVKGEKLSKWNNKKRGE
ncbi:MAG: haloacid dehalogenase-like hydrolase [Ruminococcaceae bacterium]|nr:haloacid dehalogenase-like hydrolase [Oscillospiraceae bacterium]